MLSIVAGNISIWKDLIKIGWKTNKYDIYKNNIIHLAIIY